MANESQDILTPLFAALADPTRRAVLHRLGTGAQPISDLAAGHDMALPSFMKHVGKLERAGLIHTEKAGRVRTCHLNPEALQPMKTWLAQEERRWAATLDRLSAHLDALDQETRQ